MPPGWPHEPSGNGRPQIDGYREVAGVSANATESGLQGCYRGGSFLNGRGLSHTRMYVTCRGHRVLV